MFVDIMMAFFAVWMSRFDMVDFLFRVNHIVVQKGFVRVNVDQVVLVTERGQ